MRFKVDYINLEAQLGLNFVDQERVICEHVCNRIRSPKVKMDEMLLNVFARLADFSHTNG